MTDVEKLAKYHLDLTEAIVGQIMTTVTEERKSKGEVFSEELLLSILASLTLNAVLRVLEKPSSGTDETNDEYQEMKAAIENCISAAFTEAFVNFAPKTKLNFYCEIEPVMPNAKMH